MRKKEIDRTKEIVKASWISIGGNTVLAILKISIGTLSGSLAVISDGIDSITDILVSFVTLFTSKIISKPPDKEHPYGHARAETIATKILSFIIFFAGSQLIFTAIKHFIGDDIREIPSITAIYVTIFSICGKCVACNFISFLER